MSRNGRKDQSIKDRQSNFNWPLTGFSINVVGKTLRRPGKVSLLPFLKPAFQTASPSAAPLDLTEYTATLMSPFSRYSIVD
jgi:hypothetical protein